MKPTAYLHDWTTFGHGVKGRVSLHPVHCSERRQRVIGPLVGERPEQLKQGDAVETANCRYVLGERDTGRRHDGNAGRALHA